MAAVCQSAYGVHICTVVFVEMIYSLQSSTHSWTVSTCIQVVHMHTSPCVYRLALISWLIHMLMCTAMLAPLVDKLGAEEAGRYLELYEHVRVFSQLFSPVQI